MTVQEPISRATIQVGALRSLQIGRALAALAVVLFHLNNSIWTQAKYFPDPFSPILSFGNAGVQFFFVLSGFIIYLVHHGDIGRPDRLRRFAWRRFVRIYPVYWIALIGFVSILYLEPFVGTADERRIGNAIASFLLIPAPVEPILSVAWTLKHEVMFYIVFALAILRKRAGIGLFVLWQLACAINTLAGSPDFPYGVLLSANNLLFSIGLLAAYLFVTRRCPVPGWVAAGGIVVFLVTGLHQIHAAAVAMPTDGHIISYGLAAGVAIIGACSYERRYGLRAPRWLDTIGDASYSIYLIHLPLLSVLAKLLFASGLARELPEPISLAGLLCAVVIAGIAFSRVVEMPLLGVIGRIAVPPDQRRSRATV